MKDWLKSVGIVRYVIDFDPDDARRFQFPGRLSRSPGRLADVSDHADRRLSCPVSYPRLGQPVRSRHSGKAEHPDQRVSVARKQREFCQVCRFRGGLRVAKLRLVYHSCVMAFS